MRLRMTDVRERRMEHLKEATGEKTKSKAIDKAADYYIKMRGDTTAVPGGKLSELLALAEENGSVTAAEIVEVLDVDELPLKYQLNWSVGSY